MRKNSEYNKIESSAGAGHGTGDNIGARSGARDSAARHGAKDKAGARHAAKDKTRKGAGSGSKTKTRLILIAVLLVAVAAAAFGIFRIEQLRSGRISDGSFGITSDSGSGEESAASDGKGNVTDGEGATGVAGADGSPAANSGAAAESAPLATLFFASDYQAEYTFDEPSATLSAILQAAKSGGKKIDRFVFCGDYTNDRQLQNYQISPDDSIEEIQGVVSSVYPGVGASEADAGTGADAESDAGAGTSAEANAGAGTNLDADAEAESGADKNKDQQILFVQGNHDAMSGMISSSGLYEADDYLIYVLNTEEDFPWVQGKTAGCLAKVRKSSAALRECLDGLIKKGETRPLFIAGHVPLHFTARTSSRHTTGDNLYASLIFDVVNEAAKSLDIVYLYGHNHSKGWDCYLGGSSVYKAPGDTVLIPEFSEDQVNTDSFAEQTLNFTYMNAGYTGYYMNCGVSELEAGAKEQYSAADETLTGTVFEVYRDKIVITRYDVDGVHVLGHDGEADPYKGGIDEGLIPEKYYSRGTDSPQERPRRHGSA